MYFQTSPPPSWGIFPPHSIIGLIYILSIWKLMNNTYLKNFTDFKILLVFSIKVDSLAFLSFLTHCHLIACWPCIVWISFVLLCLHIHPLSASSWLFFTWQFSIKTHLQTCFVWFESLSWVLVCLPRPHLWLLFVCSFFLSISWILFVCSSFFLSPGYFLFALHTFYLINTCWSHSWYLYQRYKKEIQIPLSIYLI